MAHLAHRPGRNNRNRVAFTHPARDPNTCVVALRRVTNSLFDREAALRNGESPPTPPQGAQACLRIEPTGP